MKNILLIGTLLTISSFGFDIKNGRGLVICDV
jgi:hypothetical protein